MIDASGSDRSDAAGAIAGVTMGALLGPAVGVLRAAVAIADYVTGRDPRPAAPTTMASIVIFRDGEVHVPAGQRDAS